MTHREKVLVTLGFALTGPLSLLGLCLLGWIIWAHHMFIFAPSSRQAPCAATDAAQSPGRMEPGRSSQGQR